MSSIYCTNIDPLKFSLNFDRTRTEPCEGMEEEGKWTISLPTGAAAIATLEPNQSTTLQITLADGQRLSWNSGKWITCKVLGTGVSLMGTIGGRR